MKNSFWGNLKYFFKKNAYALSVTVCVVLAITMISLTVSNYIDKSDVSPQVIDVWVPEEEVVPTNTDDAIIFALPVADGKICKEYAENHLIEDKTSGYWQTHQAIDFVAPEGTTVFSVYDGTVESVNESMMDGFVITILHGGGLKSVYKCLSNEVLVSQGDKVVKGQEIGKVSNNLTEKADGPHLHFELYENDKLVDPTPYFAELGK